MPVINTFTSPYETESEDIKRRRKLYEALQAQSMESTPTQSIGGWAIPNSPMQGFSKVAQALVGAYGQKKLGDEQKALGERRNKALTDALGGMPQSRQETTQTPFDMASVGQDMPDETQIPGLANEQTRTIQPTMQDNASWLGKLAQIDPSATSIGSTMLGMQQKQNENRETREARIAAALESTKAATTLQTNLLADRQVGRDQTQAGIQAGRDQNEGMRRDLAADADRRSREMQTSQQQFARQAQLDRAANRPAPAVGGRPPSGYRFSVDGETLEAIPGGPRDGPTPLTATMQRELLKTDESIQGGVQALEYLKEAKALNDKAMGGFGSGAIATAGTILPNAIRPQTIDDTRTLDNLLQSSALPQLKSIFGGNPTEGERKILMDVQGSSGQTAAVRKGIFDRAEQAIRLRLKFAQDKAKAVREGTYFSGDGGIDPAAPPVEAPATPQRRSGDAPQRRSGDQSGWSVVR